MVKVTVIKDRLGKRIIKCRYENKIWYQLWLTQLDMICIERFFYEGSEAKRWWLPNLQLWYVFFYEKNAGKRKGVLGKDRTKVLINSIP